MQTLLSLPTADLSDDQLSDLTIYLNTEYRKGSPKISDQEFDLKYLEALKVRIPEHSLFNNVQPTSEAAKNKVEHPEPMLSTDKAYTRESVAKWIGRIIKAGQSIGLSPDKIIIEASSKLDGIAGRYTANNNGLYSRGNGHFGQDISHISKNGLVVVGDASIDGIGEVVMRNEFFDKHFSQEALGENGFVDSRGFIAGMANSNEIKPHGKKALDNGFVELVIYKDMPRSTCSADDFMDQYEALESKHLVSPYMLDGVIFDAADERIRSILGYTSHHPIWRIAKKKIKGAKPATVNAIRWQTGRTQVITPVLEVDEVILTRKKVTSITGHGLGYILKNKLGVGSVMLAHLSGDVIPSYLETITPVEPDYPSHCPCCDAETYIRISKDKNNIPTEFLMCSNTVDCSGSTVSYLFHAFKRLGIDLFGRKSNLKLVDNKITTLEQIFTMSEQDFIDCGFGQGQTANFMAELSRGIREPLKDSDMIAALGIPLLGRGTSKKILEEIKITELSQLTYDKLLSLPGFADISAKAIINGLAEKKATIEFLLSLNFNLSHTSETVVVIEEGNGLNGLSVVFTGKMTQGSRGDMSAQAAAKGAKIQAKINKNTDYLIFGDKVGKTKIEAAKELGVTTISEQEYIDKFGT